MATLFSRLFGGFGEAKPPSKEALLEKIKHTDIFRDLPPQNLEQMYAHMETVVKKKGDVIITEGEEGDYYYLLAAGTADVSKKGPDGKPQVVAVLQAPAAFGEEALISNAKRNATVTMTSNGSLMRLSKDAFSEYVKDPLVTWFSPKEAQDKIAQGAKWLDVRDEEEARKGRFHGAILIPLPEIRAKMSELDKNTLYICYCQNGRQSSTAAFLLHQKGYNVGVLRGGIQGLQRAGLA